MDTSINPIITILKQGKLTLKGEFLWGSNYTFLVEVNHLGDTIPGVYKPVRGERPLWDFPPASLSRREVAAYLVSEALGWKLVPPTVFRKGGPLGSGSLQLYVDHDPEYHYFTFLPEDIERLRPIAVFDLLINNADRKGSHILKSPDGHLWLIDHGLCFHLDDKLRTVIWNFIGDEIPPQLLADIKRFQQALKPVKKKPDPDQSMLHSNNEEEIYPDGFLNRELRRLLSRAEIIALARRAEMILLDKIFPAPDPTRRPVPWPQL